MSAGDTLFLFTDGMLEAMNEKDEEYGDSLQFKDFLKLCLHTDLRNFKNNLLADIKKFTNNDTFQDDITALIIRKNGRLNEK